MNAPITEPDDDLSPLTFHNKYMNDELIEEFVKFTNLYASQQGETNFKETTLNEMKAFFGLEIAMGCLKFPRISMFWHKSLGINLFLNAMSKKRFSQLRHRLHIVDNQKIPTNCEDKFRKTRPFIEAVRKRCLEVDRDDFVCIDEQVIPFTGCSSIKQYIKGR